MIKNTKVKLNLGCGITKLKGYINIDATKSCKPDIVCDVSRETLPFKPATVDEVVMFHTIEHIQKVFHVRTFLEIGRVLKKGGRFIVSYPDFWRCAINWKENLHGDKKFWEATIFGRQAYPGDFHVSLMESKELGINLKVAGFDKIKHKPEKTQPFNTITVCYKNLDRYKHHEEIISEDIDRVKVVTVKHKK